jgi:hypothetical protein
MAVGRPVVEEEGDPTVEAEGQPTMTATTDQRLGMEQKPTVKETSRVGACRRGRIEESPASPAPARIHVAGRRGRPT